MKRSWAVVLGVLGVIDLLGIAYVWAVPNIEDKLEARSETELAAANIAGVSVDFEGRNGTVTGTDAEAAAEALESVSGARWVRAEVTPPASASISITSDGAVVELEGLVDTEARSEELIDEIEDAGFEVDESLRFNDELAGEQIDAVVPLIGPLLDGTDDGELTLRDGTVTLTGVAFDPVEFEEIEMAIDDVFSGDIEVENEVTILELSEDEQIVALEVEIDQIFELARAIAGESPNFDVSDGELSSQTTETLDRVAVAMRRYPLPSADIIGHTDSQGDEGQNLILSEGRAATVLDYLAGQGVDEDRLSAVGRGESEPIADNDTESGRSENRRVDFIVKKSGG